MNSNLKMKYFLSAICIIFLSLFVIASFYDIQMMEILVKLFSINVVKFIAMVAYKVGSLLIAGIIAPLFVYITIVYVVYVNKDKRFFKYLHQYRKLLMTLAVLGYLVIFLIIYLPTGIQQMHVYHVNSNPLARKGVNSDGILEVHFLYSLWTTGLTDIIVVVGIAVINFIVYFCFVFTKLVDNQIINSYYFKPFLTMLIFILFSYAMIFVVKHLTGRPLYMNVGWTRENAIANGLNPDLSIEARFAEYGWAHLFDPNGMANGKYSNADYFEWWQVNNLKNNLHNWWRWPESWVNDNNDHYWDMDFPSGHIFSFAGLTVMGYAMYFSPYYRIHHKFSLTQKCLWVLLFAGVGFSGVTLIIQMFHWPTDVFFSIATCPIFFYLSMQTFDLLEKRFYLWKAKRTHVLH